MFSELYGLKAGLSPYSSESIGFFRFFGFPSVFFDFFVFIWFSLCFSRFSQKSIDFACTVIDFHCFSSFFIDFHWFSLVFIVFSLISIDFHRFVLIFIAFH